MALGTYNADPEDETQPADSGVAMGYAFAELRALKARVNQFEEDINTLAGDHIADNDNPHTVTKAQVGLSNLPNAKSDAVNLNDSESLATSAAAKTLNDRITQVLQDRIFPIGSYYITENSSDPATLLGFGTWTRLPAGYGIVSKEPSNNLSPYYSVGDQGGNFTKTLDANDLPAHTHPDNFSVDSVGDHTHSRNGDSTVNRHYGGGSSSGTSSTRGFVDNDNAGPTGAGGAHDHDLSGGVQNNTTQNNSFSLMSPYRIANIWRRTS